MKRYVWVVPFPQRSDDCGKHSDEYWKLWTCIQEIYGGGACAAAYAPEKSSRWTLVVEYLNKIFLEQRNDPFALNFLARCYAEGEGVERDMKKARQGFLDAGNLLLPVAWFNLGILHSLADDPDFVEVVNCFTMGKRLGCSFCANKISALGS